jgi:ribosomal protein S18 acetylase RimI-like enzyme
LPALAPHGATLLVVVDGNDDAVRFYQGHGLREVGRVDAHAYYRETAGIVFPEAARNFHCILMRYQP